MVLPVQKQVVPNPFAYLSIYLLFNEIITCWKQPGTHRQTSLGRRGSSSQAGVHGTDKLVLPGWQSRACCWHTSGSWHCTAALPGSGQKAKELFFKQLCFTVLFLASRGRNQGEGGWIRLREGMPLHPSSQEVNNCSHFFCHTEIAPAPCQYCCVGWNLLLSTATFSASPYKRF